MANQTKTEIQNWLEVILSSYNLNNITFDILGNTKKGDGYLGDIVFVHVIGTNFKTSQKEEHNIVLKCSKKSKILREKSSVKAAFQNEIYLYDVVLPDFQQFQLSRNIQNVFDSFPKIYGKLTNELCEIIALENLKKVGYILWNKQVALTRKHLLMVVKEYGKLHSISVAMQDQEPQRFKNLANNLQDVWQGFMKNSNLVEAFRTSIKDAYDVLQGFLPIDVLEKWLKLSNNVDYIYGDMRTEKNVLKVITHGDCWNNNFMWKHVNNNETLPERVAIIDWQISFLTSPILDLSYFLFACTSKEDLQVFDDVLDTYYTAFSDSLKEMGSDPEKLYSRKQFLLDWKKYARYGIATSSLNHKMAFSNSEAVHDIVESVENGDDISQTFLVNINDINLNSFRYRIRPIVEYAVQNGLID